MGRYSKKRKQEEARIRAEDAKKTFVENILEFSEKQQEELERLERRINRKKILINKKYRVAYDKIQKEEREKQQRIFEKYDRYIEKRQNEIKGDLESIEEKKNKISLRQFLLKVILERETGVKTAWTEESSDVAVEAKISISGGTVKSKLRALQSEFIDRFNKVMGTVPGTDIPAYQYLSKGGKNIYLTEDNCDFLRLIMCYDEGEGVEYDIVGCAISNNMEKLDEKLQNQVKDGMYTLAYNPDTKIDEAMVQERLRSLFGMGSAQIADTLERIKFVVSQMQELSCFSEGQRYVFKQAEDCLDSCYAEIEKIYSQYVNWYCEDDEFESAIRIDFYAEEALQRRTEGTRYIQNENAVFLFCDMCRMDNHTVQPNLYNGGRKVMES